MSTALHIVHDATPNESRLDLAARVHGDFPFLTRKVHGKRLAYLDNAASTQKPRQVIDAIVDLYEGHYANIHRGVHLLSQESTQQFEGARKKVQTFLNAASRREIVFLRGTTEAINLVAHSFARPRLGPGDEIVITAMEHHSNIVPWQLICEQTGAKLRVAPMTDDGRLIVDDFRRLLGARTKLVGIVHLSNALGTINPVKTMIDAAHEHGIPVLIDGAQAVAHIQVDVQALDCDFYAFSSHKIYGPTGTGVLYGKRKWLEAMPPWQGGGDMIASVTFEKSTWAELPHKFEAGTPDIAGVIGLGAALDYVGALGLNAIATYENELLATATKKMQAIDRVRIIGRAPCKASVLSFVIDGIHPHDLGTILDREGVAVRTGHHCAQPVMDRLGIPATTRASLAFYNTHEDIDALVAGVRKAIEVFG